MQAIKINPEDVVAVALTDLKQGQEVKLENDAVILKEDIPRGHKFALYDLTENNADNEKDIPNPGNGRRAGLYGV